MNKKDMAGKIPQGAFNTSDKEFKRVSKFDAKRMAKWAKGRLASERIAEERKSESPRAKQIREMNEKSAASGAKIKGKGSWYKSGPNEAYGPTKAHFKKGTGLVGKEEKEMLDMKASKVNKK